MGDRASMRNKLTAVQVKKAGDGKHYDGGGLVLVRKGGVGKWVFRYSHLGRRREMGIGSQAELTLADARRIRDQWASELAKGHDPIDSRNAQRAAERDAVSREDPTLEDMAIEAFEARKASLRGEGTRGRWMSPLDLHVIPKIGRKRMSKIHQKDIKDALSPIWRKKHPTAQKAINRIRIVFTHARLAGFDCDPFTVHAAEHMLGVVKHEPRHVPATRWQDIPDLYQALTQRGNHASCLALRWAILTVVRSMAVRGARFDEIEGDVWTVPVDRIKGHEGRVREFRVPLSAEAQAVAKLCSEFSDNLLFPGLRGTPISDVAVNKMLRSTGIEGTLHGLRTSFRTWVQDNQVCTYEVAETVLGHTIGNKVERSYARSDLLEPRRVVLDAWARFATGQDAKVVPISAGKSG
ncbi:tyrosine-type recombinase/integrase [Aliiroseovarius zhejiangensis]|nr:integrase arm-type DNA-binding domain-containing protein [Aliiroseovarius zhejiangensis]